MHTIFWSGGTNPFQGRPSAAPHDYIGMIRQYVTDVADASTGTSGQTCTVARCNVFTVEPQYGWGTTPGGITHGAYSIHFASGDSLLDTQPYPSKPDQCASPQNTAVCVTDGQVQAEVNRVINATHGTRGLHDLGTYSPRPASMNAGHPGRLERRKGGQRRAGPPHYRQHLLTKRR